MRDSKQSGAPKAGEYRQLIADARRVLQRDPFLDRSARNSATTPESTVSGNPANRRKCKRETNWLDIVASSLKSQHSPEMIAKVILGSHEFVNVEAPRAIADLSCHKCKSVITDLRSFKCHNWAYARPELLDVIESVKAKAQRRA